MLLFKKHNDFTISENGISMIEDLQIGGIKQSILIQAENPNNPVLLFLHGGPSMPLPGVSCRSADYALAVSTKELVKYFVVVFWDQRGTGKSYQKDITKESLHLEQFITDAVEVTDYLRNRFDKKKIFLVAHSWGTTIGLHLANRYPEKYHSYTAMAQIVSWTENDRLGYRWVMEQAKAENNQKAIQELIKLGEPPYNESFEQWGKLRKWLVIKYHSMFYNTGDSLSPTLRKAMNIMLKSKDYSIRDIINSVYTGFKLSYTGGSLLSDLMKNNFLEEVPKVDIPIYFIHGKHETHVFPELLLSYYDKLEAPQGKRWFWLEHSSHAYHPNDARVAEKILITEVLGASVD
jgi:pimeloyl-ACP methyl ester carboxylesterase